MLPLPRFPQTSDKRGFTLIELSIVLVIVGLIVGGILVGRDLIEAAKIRATVSQIQQYKVAANTFRLKYNGLPGDLTKSIAQDLGFTIRAGSAGHGDGNGIIEGCSAAAVGTLTKIGCETAVFWHDLSDAKLVAGTYSGTDGFIGFARLDENDFGIVPSAMAAPPIGATGSYLPEAKIQNGNYFIIYADTSKNFFEIAGVTSGSLVGAYTLSNALTPLQAYNIDIKLDDGLPLTGKVIATEGTGPDIVAVPGAATCVLTGGVSYNVAMTTMLCHSSMAAD